MPMGNKPYPVKKGVTNGYPTHVKNGDGGMYGDCLLYTSPSPRDRTRSRMPSSA